MGSVAGTKDRFSALEFVVVDRESGRPSYWNVIPSGDHTIDMRLGGRYARATVTWSVEHDAPYLIGFILEAMPRPYGGIEQGFVWALGGMAREALTGHPEPAPIPVFKLSELPATRN